MSCPRFLVAMQPSPWLGQGDPVDGFAVPSDLQAVGQCGSMQAWVSGATPVIFLPEGRGWILGHLFRKDEAASTITGFSASEAEALVASQGQVLADDYWGSYIALLCPDHGETAMIVRDPSGLMPAYLYRAGNYVYCVSDIGVLMEAGVMTPAVDWIELFGHLLAQEFRRRQTCLQGVSELSPGTVTIIDHTDRHERRRELWSPLAHVAPIRGSSDELALRLERTVVASVGALARPYSRILSSVSGGLDSSIVSAALAASGQPFTCFTLATHDPSGDERRYAHEIASEFGADCVDAYYDPLQIAVHRSMAQHLPRPVGRLFMQQIEHAYGAAAARSGCEAVFTGNGGDNVFSYLHAASPAVDRLLVEGLGRGAWETTRAMCRITGCDLWTMGQGIMRGLRRRRQPHRWPRDTRLLPRDRIEDELSPALTPWLGGHEGLLPGKRAHIFMLMRIQNFIEGYERRASLPVVAPLLSQPVVELCLSIPSWRWAEGGINRSMARHAFRASLPRSTLDRTAKAGPESLTAGLFERALPTLRAMLLGGLLAQHGLIDKVAVEEALTRTATRRGQLFHRLLALAEAEAWSRHWTGLQAG